MKVRIMSTFKAALVLIAGLMTVGFAQTVSAAPVLSSVSVSPNFIPSGGSATVTVTVTENCPTGGCSVGLYSQSPYFPLPSSMLIPAGSKSASRAFTAGINNQGYTMNFQVAANYGGVYKSVYPWIEYQVTGPVISSVTMNAGNYVYSGKTMAMVVTLSQACPSGGCELSLYTTNSSLINLPYTFLVPAGQSKATISAIAGSTSYPQPISVSVSFNGSSFYSPYDFVVFAPLGTPAADGSYTMMAFGSSSRTGTGGVTASMNDQMAKDNMNSNVALVDRQCKVAIVNGRLVALSAPVRKGEFRDASGRLTYTYTQNFKCTK